MECLHQSWTMTSQCNLIQTVCVYAQCDFRNIDDGILQQVNDNHKQGNVSPGKSSANEQRWLGYSIKIVTQSDCSDEMLLMTTIVPYMFKHEHHWWTLAGNSSIGEQRRCDQARDDENSICVHAHQQWWMLIRNRDAAGNRMCSCTQNNFRNIDVAFSLVK